MTDRVLHLEECLDLFSALEKRETDPQLNNKFGTLTSSVEDGKLRIVMELDVRHMPNQFTIFPHAFFQKWLQQRLFVKS